MRLRALDLFLGSEPVGYLFQYGDGRNAIARFVPDAAYWRRTDAPLLSWATVTPDAPAREAFWGGYVTQPFFNGTDGLLPAFFQNMLPEGALRRHLAQIRGCAENDHFELLATCGTDLPGAVYAHPRDLRDRERDVAAIVTQHQDALEVSVTADPVADATSLSGVQPKLSLVLEGGRYVARTKDAAGVHIIAKLPSVDFPLLPEVEELSLRLAAAAGVETVRARLAPMEAIGADMPFVLDGSRLFLAVERFDRRDGLAHVHCEDFAQVFGIQPDNKYVDPRANYALMAQLMLRIPSLGQDAVLELLRRIAVNELLGNYDAHVKNFGLLYEDGRTPRLSPAYDVVAYAAYLGGRGHALRFTPSGERQARLGPATVRQFCAAAGFSETLAQATIREVVKQAVAQWPALIAASTLLDTQKQRLTQHFESVPIAQSWLRRSARRQAGRDSRLHWPA